MESQQRLNRTPISSMQMLFSAALVAFGLAGCSPKPATVRVLLPWIHSVEYAGFYMAEAKGHYAKENLTVNVIEFDFNHPADPVAEVAAGNAEFGVSGAAAMLLGRAAGKSVVGTTTIYQKNPLVLATLKSRSLTQPADLIGKKVMIDTQGYDGAIFAAMFVKMGINPTTQVTIVPRADFSDNPLINGEVDAIDVFLENQPVKLERQGHPVNLISPSDYGVDLYANVIFTTEKRIAEEPDVVERFVRATLRGAQDAVNDPVGSVDLMLERSSDLDRASEIESMRASLPLIVPAGSKPGMMSAQVWEQGHQIMLDQGLLTAPQDIAKAYTLKFLKAVYGG
jgi:NitT/TauT family transport system substrate-binding protein